jgi:hypothetical protein
VAVNHLRDGFDSFLSHIAQIRNRRNAIVASVLFLFERGPAKSNRFRRVTKVYYFPWV